ncbi:MAG TPA: GNAT family N-acetyltransferase [Phycisphaerae bacterium]|nr:GNAT family N-acetyltransferase [Phycisphaerae bacterium]
MQATLRQYNHAADYEKVNRFLVRTYRTAGGHVNWLQPRWEYMHYHPEIRDLDLRCIGVWEAKGEIVAVVHPEHAMGRAYFQIDPECAHLKRDMLTYAEQHLSASADGAQRLRVIINDDDGDFCKIASERGYTKSEAYETMSHLRVSSLRPAALPQGFRLKSLAEDNDLPKLTRVLWRGFNHGDEPPDDGVEHRQFMQSAPSYRKDLNIVVEAPDGQFVSYCGMWYEPVHAIAYVEPVATDPDYRRRGLARAAVTEGIRRCGELGATLACVGADLPLYLSLGFRPVYRKSIWQREWT